MPHSHQQAQRWLDLVMAQAFAERDLLAAHVAAGAITSICSCGCHGFEFAVPNDPEIEPVSAGAGMFCEMAFSSNLSEDVAILLFTDARGYFAGADVTYGPANIDPMPDGIEVNALKGIWPSRRVPES